jgi:TonB family protein
MRTRLFETLVASRDGRGARRARHSLPLSMGLHVVGVGALLAAPLLTRADLPAVDDTRTGGTPVWVPPAVRVEPTPPPAASAPRSTRTPGRPAQPAGPTIAVPTVIPDTLSPSDPGPANPDARLVIGEGCPDCGGPPEAVGFTEPGPGGDGDGPPRVVRVGPEVSPPRKLHHVAPAYPELALRAGVHGTVTIECTIDTHGRVVGARTLSGHPLLEGPARAAVEQWRYTPTLLSGVPVSVVMTVTVHFTRR